MRGRLRAHSYCFLTNQSLSYEDQLASLALADPTKPYNATTNPHVCACDTCTPHEDWCAAPPLRRAPQRTRSAAPPLRSAPQRSAPQRSALQRCAPQRSA